tara:strand:- start:164 stop:838 length:675 start_codon:yes stop_codon:yes gene_type:complete
MSETTVIAVTRQNLQPVCITELNRYGISVLLCEEIALLPSMIEGLVDMVIVDHEAALDDDIGIITSLCSERMIPVIDLVSLPGLEFYSSTPVSSDFLVVPATSLELLTRINRLLNASRNDGHRRILRIGNLTVDFERYEVSVKGEPSLLTYKEYQLLVVLASNPGIVFSRENLLTRVWGYDYFGGTRTVDVHVRRLRSKLGEEVQSYIETVWNVGYRFRDHIGT